MKLYKLVLMTIWMMTALHSFAQNPLPLSYYLPKTSYDLAIPSPESYLGFQVGEWHVSHDQLLGYFRALDAASPLITLKTYAKSHEGRTLVYGVITSTENMANIDQIKKSHQELASPSTTNKVDIDNLPAILYQGYTIHGNEPSGNNAAMLVAYYLVAGQSAEVKNTLKNTVILLDPCLNPDGVQRFSTWVNSHKGQNLSTDPASRELNEAWPGGRYNHYWFDMNRDWLLLVHPESRGRIETFHEWRPNVLTDHHEMGTNSTFFFQPGIPSSVNPNTPWENQTLTEEIGTFHAAALDSIGSQYYTKANFDDFYYGKGSTYPDAHGCIGILFEQASSRGHLQESVNGLVSFPFTIRNQVTTSISSQKATVAMRKKLLAFKRDFHKMVREKLATEKVKSYVFTDADPVKLQKFIAFLNMHKVDVFALKDDQTIEGIKFTKGISYQVPLDQHNPVIAKTIFEDVRTYQDSSFYDVSGWTVAHAYGIQFKPAGTSFNNGMAAKAALILNNNVAVDENTYAVAIPSGQQNLHAVLNLLLQKGIMVRSNTSPIQLKKDKLNLNNGSLIIPIQGQKMDLKELSTALTSILNTYSIKANNLTSGNSTEMVTLGHPAVITLDKPNILVFVGTGVTPTSAGEVWHHLDKELGIAATYLEAQRLRFTNLSRYNTIIIPEGNYGGTWGDSETQKLKDWAQAGNTLIGIGSGAEWLVDKKLINLTERKKAAASPTLAYEAIDRQSDAKVIGGSIFECKVDNTHPIFYGYEGNSVALMHSGTRFFDQTQTKTASPAVYKDNFLLSGYLPKGINAMIKGGAVVTTHSVGSGRAIAFLDNPLFRGYWYAGMKAFNNAIYFGKALDRRSLESEE